MTAELGSLADRQYSRQTPGAVDFVPPGRKLVLLTDDARAVWGVCENLDPAGALVLPKVLDHDVKDLDRECDASGPPGGRN